MTDREEKILDFGSDFLGKIYNTEVIKLVKYLNENPPVSLKLAAAIIGMPEPSAQLIIVLCAVMGVFKYDEQTKEISIDKGGKDIIDFAFRFGNLQYMMKESDKES
jgi:hypothetical protein